VRERIGSNEHEFFNERVKAAAKLYEAGQVRYLIVSGDNHKKGYDDPTDLKIALIANYVPAERIDCDYAGFARWTRWCAPD
jgi:SanA protein